MTIKKIYTLWAVAALALGSCVSDHGQTIPLEPDSTPGGDIAPIDGIPSDALAGFTNPPSVSKPTVPMPDVAWRVVDGPMGVKIAEFVMPGLRYPSSEEWMNYLTGTGGEAAVKQGVWVSVDGDAKGCKVVNNYNGEVTKPIDVDMVLLVNNSNNMGEAGDKFYFGLEDFATKIADNNISARYGCVGYGGGESVKGVDGACSLTDAASLKAYLGREGCSGVTRTKGFADADELEHLAQSRFQNCDGECGVEALKFADEAFTFRTNAYRIYLNVTDEPNQPGGDAQWSVEAVKSQEKWPAGSGTIHTLYSGYKMTENETNSFEFPWLLSDYTGGFTTYTDSKLTDVTLQTLPVVESMRRFVVIRIAKVEKYMDGKAHDVKITVQSIDEKIKTEKTYKVVFGSL